VGDGAQRTVIFKVEAPAGQHHVQPWVTAGFPQQVADQAEPLGVPAGGDSGILLGCLISTAVVRQPNKDNEYAVWGIHLATDDQLTFLSKDDPGQPIVTRMVDCRRHSPTRGTYLEVTSYANVGERLVIPRGVAHLPTDVGGLITINTPTLYWDFKHRRANSRRPDHT
jgi:hypothetical protein